MTKEYSYQEVLDEELSLIKRVGSTLKRPYELARSYLTLVRRIEFYLDGASAEANPKACLENIRCEVKAFLQDKIKEPPFTYPYKAHEKD